MSKEHRRRIITLLEFGAAVAVGVAIGLKLAPYDLPFFVQAACVLGTANSAMSTLKAIEDAWTTTTHRCTAPGCDFRVRLQHTDAGENRVWREAAANHPSHTASRSA
ncbi:hypothetical protein [Streptomyces sp. NPDC046821]|uniref:hypothetical protein n=1 Tax=Streptomyces sp. NPDC046821 TaxID=3154702 RepID=UPI0033EAADF7